MAEKQTKTKLTPGVISRIAIGTIFVAVVLILLVASNAGFFQGSLQNISGKNSHPASDAKTGTLIVEYIKIPDKNEIKIGAKEESLGKYSFKVQNEPVSVDALTFEMEGNISKDNFDNIKLIIGEKTAENAEFLWESENSLLVDLSAENIEIQDEISVELTADINGGDQDQMFAFHFVEIVAKGKSTGKKIESVGVNGSATPMPQIHVLKK